MKTLFIDLIGGLFSMSDNIFGTQLNPNATSQAQNPGSSCFKEAVCIDAYRIYDSCADKDCLENLRVYFTESGQHIIDQACNVRIKDVNILTVYVDLEPVPFNRGFYSVDLTFFFEINLDVFLSPAACPVNVCGLSVFSKKVILYGSEGNVKIFSSDDPCFEDSANSINTIRNLPKAICQAAQPIGLSAKVCCSLEGSCDPTCHIPDSISRKYGGEFITRTNGNNVYATIGIFTIVQIERNVQMLIPAYDFCIPEKECIPNTDNPCELFNRLEFPTDEFFPPKVTEINSDVISGCR